MLQKTSRIKRDYHLPTMTLAWVAKIRDSLIARSIGCVKRGTRKKSEAAHLVKTELHGLAGMKPLTCLEFWFSILVLTSGWRVKSGAKYSKYSAKRQTEDGYIYGC